MSMEQKTILFIEVEAETRQVIKANLEARGYRVVVALDEDDVLEQPGEDGCAPTCF